MLSFEEWLKRQQIDPNTETPASLQQWRAAYEATRPTQADKDEFDRLRLSVLRIDFARYKALSGQNDRMVQRRPLGGHDMKTILAMMVLAWCAFDMSGLMYSCFSTLDACERFTAQHNIQTGQTLVCRRS